MEAKKNRKSPEISLDKISELIVGYHKQVPLLNGDMIQYINFDNAASTPALKPVLDKVNEAMEWYSSIHRGTGFKSQLCSELYDQSRKIVAAFVKADIEKDTIIFVQNATEAINKLANLLPIKPDEVVLVSKMEHHSNDLPWRAKGKVIHVNILPDGRLDVEDLIAKLKKYHQKVAIVAITGASNVSGWVNDVHELAQICHEYDSQILIDAAQLAPHRSIDMKPHHDQGHIDFLALSAHKIYAPFGSGALIGPKAFFEEGDPDYVGGGTVNVVTLEYATWIDPPEKDEAGTPNTIGVIAMAKSLHTLMDIGMDKISEHEKQLTGYILKQLRDIPKIEIYGSADPEVVDDRLGVITFNIKDMPHALTAAILNYEYGVGVRNGCFCAHPYVKLLLGLDDETSKKLEQEMLEGDRSNLPGAVRASFGLYNSIPEIDRFIDALKKIVVKKYEGTYVLDKKEGAYYPRGYIQDFQKFLTL